MRSSSSISPRGSFVSFEGGEGSGKSTLLSRLKVELSKNYRVVFSFEPGGSELGQEIRESLIKPRSFVSPRAEALLYAAARAQHVEELIEPELEKGTHVFLDRYLDASLAYQGVARGLGLKQVRDLNDWATGALYPERTYFLDIDPGLGLKRARGRPQLDRIEQEGLPFHERIRQAYRYLAANDSGRFVIIDASREISEVFRQVYTDLLGWLSPNVSKA